VPQGQTSTEPSQESLKSYNDYLELFSQARQQDVLIGEDSTTYLSSEVAALQIANTLTSVKLIFILRNPIDRAYSHYWHQVSRGRAFLPFEAWIVKEPNIIRRGLYGQHLARYFNLFDREQMRVIIFEDFLQNKQAVIDNICQFLGLAASLDVKALNAHHNQARIRQHVGLSLAFNRADTSLPYIPALSKLTISALSMLQDMVNPIVEGKKYPPMSYSTRYALLDKFKDDTELLASVLENPSALDVWGICE